MSNIWTALLAVLGVAITSAGTYLISQRVHGGSVDSSDADTIFRAAEELRQEQRAEVMQLREDVAASRQEILSLRTEITSLRTEITSLREESGRLRLEADRLRAEAAISKSEAAILRRKVADQEAAVSAVQREITGAAMLAKDIDR